MSNEKTITGNQSPATNITYYRVIYGDCDSMAIVYYANYLKFFEIGRTELLREAGLTYRQVEESGFFLPTTETCLKYVKPALYDDLLTIETTIGFVKRASSRFDYTVYRGEDVVVRGYTIHACLDKDNKIVRFPDFLRNVLKGK
ncbi:MAG: acyl-CoA thioesterase [Deltaproteobacteria bacterium]|nr:acyl-CoA thioesterase [Deltaproteobacteria bacterium]MBW2334332.1 acyl-CoA thioesterase [Deltaproteobacteria bacterium]